MHNMPISLSSLRHALPTCFELLHIPQYSLLHNSQKNNIESKFSLREVPHDIQLYKIGSFSKLAWLISI